MKNFSAPLLLVLIIASVLELRAQAPNKISFQAVIRNANNDLVRNTAIGMRVSILQGSAAGTVAYAETHAPMANANGLVSIEIGGGSVVSGNFATIDWAAGSYFIKTETDPAGGTNYTITGTQQLLSVPYAQFSNASLSAQNATTVNAAGITGTIADDKLSEHLQDLADGSLTGSKVGAGINAANITTGTLPIARIADGAVTSAKIADGSIATADLANNAVTDAKIANVAPGKIAQGGATTGQVLKWNGTAWAPLADDTGAGTIPTLTTGQLITNNGASNIAVTMDGDATFAASGALTIANNAVTTARIADGTITNADISTTAAIAGAKISPEFGEQNITTTGNVGIGNTNPTEKLHVRRTAGASSTPEARFSDGTQWTDINTNSTAGSFNPMVQMGDHTFIYSNGSQNTGGLVIGQWSSVAPARAIRIAPDGNVGIGTAIPEEKLHVGGNVHVNGNVSTISGKFRTDRANAAAVTSSGIDLMIGGNTQAGIYTPTSGTMALYTSGSERVRITSNGDVGIGTTVTSSIISRLYVTSPDEITGYFHNTGTSFDRIGIFARASGAGAGEKFGVVGEVSGNKTVGYGVLGRALGAGTTNYGVYGSAVGATTNWAGYFAGNVHTTGSYSSSDIRLKENIQALKGSLHNLIKINGVEFDWRFDKYPDRGLSKNRQYGFIAQEVEKIFPDLVLTDSDGYKTINYNGVIAVTVEALKEQQTQIEALKIIVQSLLSEKQSLSGNSNKETGAMKANE